MVVNRTRRSRKQEAAGAQIFGGKVVPGSGSGWAVKNDVRTDDVSFEYKFTDNKSFSLKSADLIKAERQALLDGGREMAFIVELEKREWAVITRDFLVDLLERAHRGYSEPFRPS